ncbi:MAG TPA: cell division protein [Cytophagales bacterium]|nr:cell division protein [Cytophagales bacterium]HAP61913.1 cell division protein [Cytophagales bacterium]
MPIIELETEIRAPIERCFLLSLSVDLHRISTAHTQEEAIAGVTSGLIGLNETVTWRARHLGITQTLTTKITELTSPTYFVDEMLRGAFKSFRHEHIFSENGEMTIMKDIFNYRSPLGLLGKLADAFFLERYMQNLLVRRNETIKSFAETERWQEVL